jgi:hypothetical protein
MRNAARAIPQVCGNTFRDGIVLLEILQAVKELVLRNFAGISQEQLLERMIELSLYTEEKLKSG